MSARLASCVIDLAALVIAAALVVFAGAPASTVVSVLSVLVAVRAGRRGRDNDEDDGPDGGGSPVAQTPRLGGAARPAPPSLVVLAQSSALVAVARGIARWLSRAHTAVRLSVAAGVVIAVVSFAVLSGCGGACRNCQEPSGWTRVEWAGSCCYRAYPCLSEAAEFQLYDACAAQSAAHPYPVLCGGDTLPQGCIPLTSTPEAQCAEGVFDVVCCSEQVP